MSKSKTEQEIVDTAVVQFMRSYKNLDGRQTEEEGLAWRSAIRSMMVGLDLYNEFIEALPDERPENPERYFSASPPNQVSEEVIEM